MKDYDLSSVYFLQCGGAPLTAELQESLVRILPDCTIGQGYGSSPPSRLHSSDGYYL